MLDTPEPTDAPAIDAVRAMFRVQATTPAAMGGGGAVTLVACIGPDNASWAAATPSGAVTMAVTQAPAFAFFKPGREYYLTFERAIMPRAEGDETPLEDASGSMVAVAAQAAGLSAMAEADRAVLVDAAATPREDDPLGPSGVALAESIAASIEADRDAGVTAAVDRENAGVFSSGALAAFGGEAEPSPT